MKKLFWLSIIFLAISGFTFAEEYDFKNVRWGMTKEDVTKSEPQTPTEINTKSLVFEDKVDNRKCLAIYFFQENQLYCSGYLFTEEHSNKDDYIADFNSLKQFLIKKYGKPQSDDLIIGKNFSQDDLQNRGSAISMGHLQYKTAWETERSKIALMLFGENSRIKLTLFYDGKIATKAPELNDKTSPNDKGDFKIFCLGDTMDVCKEKYDLLKKNKELPGGLFNNYKSFTTEVAEVRMECNFSFHNGRLSKISLETSNFYTGDHYDTVKSIVIDKFKPIFLSLYGEPTSSFGFPSIKSLKNGYTTYAYRWTREKKIIWIGVSKSEHTLTDNTILNGTKYYGYTGVIIIGDRQVIEEEQAKKDAKNIQIIENAKKDF